MPGYLRQFFDADSRAGHDPRFLRPSDINEQLLSKVWGYDFAGETRTVDTHIKRIRAKLDSASLGWSIKTIYGVGYKFDLD